MENGAGRSVEVFRDAEARYARAVASRTRESRKAFRRLTSVAASLCDAPFQCGRRLCAATNRGAKAPPTFANPSAQSDSLRWVQRPPKNLARLRRLIGAASRFAARARTISRASTSIFPSEN